MTNGRTITYHIPNKIELNRSYMPFIQNGGLFVPTTEDFNLNEVVTASIMFPDEKDVVTVKAIIVWMTPPNSIEYPKSGVGLQFTGENATAIKDKIVMALDNNYAIGGYIFGNE